jgi:hypothetical protein
VEFLNTERGGELTAKQVEEHQRGISMQDITRENTGNEGQGGRV